MNFTFAVPTKIHFGKECVKAYADEIKQYGKKALIVTGKHSAKACGALDDVVLTLTQNNIEYHIFNEVENNPSVETVEKAADIARQRSVDMIIAIGGGSAIDAAKAIAVLAANSQMSVLDLFKNEFEKVLPIIAIPTTAGTGSEVTPYSVLLRKDIQTKVSFGTFDTYPAVALLDSKYTKTLGKETTIHTAVDAFTHALEGYLANRSTVMSDVLALEAIRTFGKSVRKLINFNLNDEDRSNLLYVSLLGGIVIAQAGVTIAHGMGYCYTFFKDIPHGKANGLLMRDYLKFNYPAAKEKIDTVMRELGCGSIDEFGDLFEQLLGKAPVLSQDEIVKYTQLTQLQKGSIANTPQKVDAIAIEYLWKKTCNEV